MTSDLQTIESNNQLKGILDTPTVSGKIAKNEQAELLQMKFSPQNSFTYESTTIVATAAKVTEAHFHKKALSREERHKIAAYEEPENGLTTTTIKQLTLDNTHLSVSTANNPELTTILTQYSSFLIAAEEVCGEEFTGIFTNTLDLIETTFDDPTFKNKLYERYVIATAFSVVALSKESGGFSTTIKDGVKVANEYHYVSKPQEDSTDDSSIYAIEGINSNQITSEINRFKQFKTIEEQINLDNSLTVEDAEKIHNQIYSKYPILNGQPLASLNSKIVSQLDILLSRTYSSDTEGATSVIQEVSEFYGKNKVIDDMLSVISLGIAKGKDFPFAPYTSHILKETLSEDVISMTNGPTITVERKDPFKIIHTNDQSDIGIDTAAGFYRPEHNVALFLQEGYRIVHEATHGSMNIHFDHEGNPYAKGDEQKYHLAAKELLINIASKLGKNTEELQEMDLDSVYSYMMQSTSLDLFALSISPADSVKDFFSEKGWMGTYKFCQKYFEDQDIDNITFEQVEIKFTEALNELILTQAEIEVISAIGKVIFRYSQENFDKELIATMLETYYQYNDETDAMAIFSPVDDYWVNNISPMIESNLIIPHQLECNGTISSNIFEYCVEEYLN